MNVFMRRRGGGGGGNKGLCYFHLSDIFANVIYNDGENEGWYSYCLETDHESRSIASICARMNSMHAADPGIYEYDRIVFEVMGQLCLGSCTGLGVG